jgi:hypothetical protein
MAEFVLALCFVFKKYLRISNIGKVSFRDGQTIAASCLVDHSHGLVCIKIYFAYQYDQ